jgi:hypothetical protein
VRKEKSLKESAEAHPPSAENRVTVEATASPPTVEAHPAGWRHSLPEGWRCAGCKAQRDGSLGVEGDVRALKKVM